MEFPYLNLCSLPLALSLDISELNLASSSLYPNRYLYTFIQSPCSSQDWAVPALAAYPLQFLNHFYSPSVDSLQYVLFILMRPEVDPALQIRLSSAEQRRRITSFNLLLSQKAVGFPCCNGALLTYVWLRTPGHDAFQLVDSQHVVVYEFVPLQMQELKCLFFRVHEIPTGHFSSLLMSL